MENKDLKWIKKHYSEKLAHICRELFPTILETEGVLPRLLSENFAQSKNLGKDLEKYNILIGFKEYIYSLFHANKEKKIEETKTPEELMNQAGYILYPECQTEKDIQSFRHYYDRGEKTPQYIEGQTPERWKGEELCTFNGGRLDNCRVWFAVKKEVAENEDAIKRSEKPSRQDEYGTSVISIQFSRGEIQFLSIKNRYNHSVSNPDATFSNNLDNIIEGLTDAFVETYNINIFNKNKNFDMPGYVKANDGKFYKYNYEINNIYYCENNTIIDNFEVKKLENRYILMDYYIIDLSEKKITLYDKTIEDCFCDTIGNIQNINITKDENKDSLIQIKVDNGEDVLITLNQQRQIIKLHNQNLTNCGNDFMIYNNSMSKLSLPKLEECGDDFMAYNESINKLSLPNLQRSGKGFLEYNNILTELSLPELNECGDYFLLKNDSLTDLSLPKLEKCGKRFLSNNNSLTELSLPNLQRSGEGFLISNYSLIKLSLPKLEECGDEFLSNNYSLTDLSLPKLEKCGERFLYQNNSLTELTLPELEECGECFLTNNNSLTNLSLPKLEKCGNHFLMNNNSLTKLSLPKLEECGIYCLMNNNSLTELTLPKLEKCGDRFLGRNESLTKLSAPNLRYKSYMLLNNNLKDLLYDKEYEM